MLIQALCDYYDVLVQKGEAIPKEYSSIGISYIISLTPDGEVDGLIDCREREVFLYLRM